MRPLFLALVPAGSGLGVLAYEVQVDSFHAQKAHAVAAVAVGLAFLLAGLIAWWRRPANRLGALMVAAGFALLLRPLRFSNDALAFTLFFALGDLSYALVVHSALAYPSGRVKDNTERWFVRVVYAAALAFPLGVLLVHDQRDPLLQFEPLHRKSEILVTRDAHAAEVLLKTYTLVFFGALAALFVAFVIRRLVRAAPDSRRILAPLLVAGIAVTLRGAFEIVFTFGNQDFAYDRLFWWYVAAALALPFALLAGLVRARLARATVGDLVIQLERTPPDGLRDALAEGLDDPTLEVAFWLPERREFVDAGGRPATLPPDDSPRAVTRLEHDGEPLAVLVHDPSLLDEPELVRAAGAAARLALENARLSAEVLAQLEKVKESRARIVSAGDAERRRIERDIHDGAQQRLVALALELRSAQRRLGADGDPEIGRVLTEAVEQLQVAVDELRELARGVHPAILTEDGLAAALESLVSRTPIPVVLDADLGQRLAPEVEATAYFVACEALANVVKHSSASIATIKAARDDGLLLVEVADDGVGGARPTIGSGLRGLADRVEALGGRLTIENPSGGGTRVVGEIPCGS